MRSKTRLGIGILAVVLALHSVPSSWIAQGFAANRATAQVKRVIQDEEGLVKAYDATGATFRGYEVHDWTSVANTFMDSQATSRLALAVSHDMQVHHLQIGHESFKGENICQVYGDADPHTHVTVTTSSFFYKDHAGETILTVRVESTDTSVQALKQSMINVTKSVADLHLSPQISACIKGAVNARLSGVQMSQVIGRSYSALRAVAREQMEARLVTSVSGYTSAIPDYIWSDRRKLNVQVATHYDAYHHRTNVLVGTPIIMTTY